MRCLEERIKARELPRSKRLLSDCMSIMTELDELRINFEFKQNKLTYLTLLRKAYIDGSLSEKEHLMVEKFSKDYPDYDLKGYDYEIEKE